MWEWNPNNYKIDLVFLDSLQLQLGIWIMKKLGIQILNQSLVFRYVFCADLKGLVVNGDLTSNDIIVGNGMILITLIMFSHKLSPLLQLWELEGGVLIK